MILSPCSSRRAGSRSRSFHQSQKVDYSLYLLAALTHADVPCSTRRIATEGGLSFSFLQKIAHLLKRAGIVRAARGKEGGYVLARTPHSITVRDVIEAVGSALPTSSCMEHSRARARCPRRNFCLLRTAVDKVHQEVMATYLSKKLTDFLN